jgi:hypothetical protein
MTLGFLRRWLAKFEGQLQQQALEDIPEAPDLWGRLSPVEPAATPPHGDASSSTRSSARSRGGTSER